MGRKAGRKTPFSVTPTLKAAELLRCTTYEGFLILGMIYINDR